MKKELSALELHCMVAELQRWVGGRLDTAHELEGHELLLQLYRTGEGKVSILAAPGRLYAALQLRTSLSSSPFAQKLRKHLKNAILRQIAQQGSERVVELVFSTKTGSFRLLLELFGTGNAVLCDDAYTILAAATYRAWRTRNIAVRERYVPPPRRFNAFSLSPSDLQELLRETGRNAVVKALAVDLGLGGVYAEELCILSSVDKDALPADITASMAKKLVAALQELLHRSPSPVVVYEDGVPVDAVPFPLRRYANLEQKRLSSYSAALEAIFAAAAATPHAKRMQSIRHRIGIQEESIVSLQLSIGENTAKANAIYEHYGEVRQLLETARHYRKTKGALLMQELEKSSVFKSFDERTGTLTLELQ